MYTNKFNYLKKNRAAHMSVLQLLRIRHVQVINNDK